MGDEIYGETFEEMMLRTEAEARRSEDSAGSPRASGKRAQRFSVVMETADGGEAAKFTMCDRSKNSVVLANTIECFADFEPPWDSDMSAQLFEDALVNLTRDEGDGLTASVRKFRERFSPGPRVGHTTSKYLIVGDDPSDATLIHVVDVAIAAPVERVKEVIWDEFLARESKADGAEASRLHAIAEDEDIYRVLRTPPRGAAPEELVCHRRYVERYSPVERVVTMAYSVSCEAAPETSDAKRLTVPLAGYVVDDVREGAAARVTWVCEQELVVGHERAIMKANARKLSDIQERLCPGAGAGASDDDDDDRAAKPRPSVTPLDLEPRVSHDEDLDDDDDAIHQDDHAHAAFCCSFDTPWARLLGLSGQMSC